MVERVVERGREPEPEELIYERIYRWHQDKSRHMAEGKVVVRGRDVPWEQSRQGLLKFIVTQLNWNEVGAPGWFIFVHDIRRHSGRHTHQGGLGIFVLEGKGYTVVNGVRHDWEAGDLIILPVMPGGCEHQHFNAEPGKPCLWCAFIYDPFRDAMGSSIQQKEDHPDWAGPKEMPHVT
ncbi:MAG: cupin domain-containing protein [Dehalococcoidia bacterium]